MQKYLLVVPIAVNSLRDLPDSARISQGHLIRLVLPLSLLRQLHATYVSRHFSFGS